MFEILNKNFIPNTPSRDHRIFPRKKGESGSRSANRSYPDVGFVFVTLNESGYEWNLKLDAYQKQDPDPFESPSLSRLKDLINSWVEYYFVKENLIISLKYCCFHYFNFIGFIVLPFLWILWNCITNNHDPHVFFFFKKKGICNIGWFKVFS